MGSNHAWTDAECAMLRRLYPDHTGAAVAEAIGRPIKGVYLKARALGLRKSDAFLASEASGRIRRGQTDPRCKAGQFRAGQDPWNKGLHYMPGGGNAHTRFQPGRPPEYSHNYKPIGALRISHDGYLQRKTTDDRRLAPMRRWECVHRLVWQAAHGPIPAGYIVVFRAGRKTTDLARITPDALEIVTRAELISRNSVHNLPKPLAQLVQLRGALVRQINRRSKNQGEDE